MINLLFWHFWKEQPALLFALCLIIGTSSYLFWSFPWNFLFPLLWSLYLVWFCSSKLILLVLGGFLYGYFLYPPVPVIPNGAAYFSISCVKPHHSPFQKGLVYEGNLYYGQHRLPCSIYYQGSLPPQANSDYLLHGKLQKRGDYNYSFKPARWLAVKNTWSFAQRRYELKEGLRTFLREKCPKSAHFLSALLTGDVEDRMLRFQFSRLGLSHILAISGFHFSILIGALSFLLGSIFPPKPKYCILLIAITAYFLFVGTLPAVQRSWIALQLFLIGKLIGRHATGLNFLGMALAIEIIGNPLVAEQIGFQLSFTCCFGIFLLYPIIEPFLCQFLPKRTPLELKKLNILSKHVYFLSSFLRQALSLTLAVNLAIWPLLLYHFHEFSLIGLFYNLFFPFLVSLSLFLLLVSFPLPFLFSLTDHFTEKLLSLAATPPIALDYSLYTASLPSWFIPLYLFGLFWGKIALDARKKQTNPLNLSL